MQLKERTRLIPRKTFFDPIERRLVKISPCGQWIAFHAPINGVHNLWLACIEDPQTARPLTSFTDRHLGLTLEWAFDGHHILFSRDQSGDENFCIMSVSIHGGDPVYLTPKVGAKAYLQEISRKHPNEILVAHNVRTKKHFDLYRVSLCTGASQLIMQNDRFAGFFTDSNFNVRLARRYTDNGEVEYLHRPDGKDWQRYTLIPFEDSLTTRPVEFSEDGQTLFWIDSRGRDKAAALAENTQTRAIAVLAQDSQADISNLLLAPHTQRPLAAKATFTRTNWKGIDPQFESVLSAFKELFAGDIEISSLSENADKLIIAHVQDNQPVEFYCYDTSTGKSTFLFVTQPKLQDLPLVRMSPAIVKTRDGLDLVCYLSRSVKAEEPHPMVLLVHGGPWMRDSWGIHPTHQWLSNRGYAVLSVNFRGSTGFGKSFINASKNEWGGKMQTDLLDAVDWAIGEGTADPNRIAIMGGSYGGFAALTGLTQTPKKFACAIDLVGISNLLSFLDTIPEYWKTWKSLYRTRLGDYTTEEGRAFLKERSPLTHVGKIEKPLLIVQGGKDVRVKPPESEQIVSAMQDHGIPVTYGLFPDEGHGIQKMHNRRAYHAMVELFLAKHLGGQQEAVGTDLEGSSLQILAGRDLIDGL
ncbi:MULTISPECIES: S9 family peptidase [unclassified Pseudovibrio]|uniref:S9 family peptidase n=1 Tax=unclassified Pseudovibrio TaxID=2627060 RepID=UPI0007B31708|nr:MULTISPECIES: S9 family peptidase [unclassified Pseudovibrio]KZK97501.1 Prolyl tripeptidyl peptidase precursor [Pseudovibrio sp. W74]KZL04794.1 Prolyl tripeptidyl peptidase precursor [Pseudovibrio sp. Ad14]